MPAGSFAPFNLLGLAVKTIIIQTVKRKSISPDTHETLATLTFSPSRGDRIVEETSISWH